MTRRPPSIPVERPLVLHLEQRMPFIRDRTAVTEHTPDVAEVADVARKRVVTEVFRVVIALVDRNVACDHHRFAVTDIGICGQCIHEFLDVLPDGCGIVVLQSGEKGVTRSHIDCGEADKLQEQSQARVGGFLHTLCQGFLLLPLHQGVVGVMTD